ncbi:MAG: glycosyltransferase family 39 protein [Acidobacteria bacterium]|nr:glycosyltransferase family 39 protein [Acidobacteriota bacterium]
MTTAASPRALADRFRPRIRLALLAGGALLVGLVLASSILARKAGGLGPAERQVLILGVLAVVAGLIPALPRFVADVLARTTRRPAAALQPISARRASQLAAIVLVALAFRGAMIRIYWPENQFINGMSLWDADMARNLLQGRGWVLNWKFVQAMDRAVVERQTLVDPQDFLPADDERPGALAPLTLFPHTPGYSLWLATGFALGHELRFAYAQWMQAALDSLACLLIFGIGRRLWSDLAGLVGALMYALSPAHVYLAIQDVAAATDSFWAVLVAYGIVRLWTDREKSRWPIAGMSAVVIGAACETAMNSYLFWLPAVAAAWAAAVSLVLPPARQTALALLVAQLLVIALLTPWALRNKRVYGQLAYTRQQMWEFVWELPLGNVPNPWGLAFGNNDVAYETWIHERCPNCSQTEREAYTRDFMLREVIPSRQFPSLFIKAVLKRLPGLVYTSRLPADKPLVPRGAAQSLLASGLRVLNVAALLIWPAAALGLWLTMLRPSHGATAWIGLGVPAFLIAFSLVFTVEHRKTTPAYGYMLALGGVAAAAFVERDAAHLTGHVGGSFAP